MERLSRFFIRFRIPIIIITLLITGYLFYAMKGLGFKTVLESTLPPKHPYVQIHAHFQEMFGGANVLLVAMESKKGNIFYRDFLEKFKYMTDEIKFYPDAITDQVISIARKKVKNIQGTSAGLDIRAFFEKGVPKTPEEINALRSNIFSNEAIRGVLVSITGNAAIIVANFKSDIDYTKLFNFVNDLKSQVEKDNDDIAIYMSGRPSLLGWIYHNNTRSLIIFAVSIIAELLLLIIFLRRFHPLFTPLPLVLALLNAIWGLGVMGLVGFNLDPLGMVVPFVIGARIISHSVQITERYGEHYRALGNKKEASTAVINSMFIPSAASIATDAAGLFVLSMVPIPLLQTLGWVSGVWLLSAILGVSILNPIAFSFLPPPFKELPKKDFLEKTLEGAGTWLMEGTKRRGTTRSIGIVMGVWAVIFCSSLFLAQKVQVGDAHPGSPLLWPDSTYNTDDARINQLFPGTNHLLVILAGKEPGVLKEPDVLHAVEAFERHMGGSKNFGGTETLVSIVKKLNREFHEGDPKWSMLPPTQGKIAFYLWMYLSKGDPGDFDRWADIPYQHGNIICYFKDHQGDTIRSAIDQAKKFLSTYPVPTEKLEFKLAGGIMGVTAAMDEVVGKYADLTLWVALVVIFLCCSIPYRSILRGVILIVSLVTANFIALAYMAVTKMGMTINVLPVASIGAGLGVDYGIYMLSRIGDEFKQTGEIKTAIKRSFSTTGRAVVITGLTVIVGIIFWYFSALRFQAEMGFLLAFLLLMNVFGALFLVPALTYIIKPAFLLKNPNKGGEKS